ncbi:RICIN domain-containing protein [Streptacidiphilus anmyonensis]|uniref:RICIN domain-containing protein n=1 Tax=Streptacidiphilus anmyonensis TaxID=405782 RepID=UPI0006950565|nr:RICIN domain-containing protein [Streptacidiphilus anmyonensis]
MPSRTPRRCRTALAALLPTALALTVFGAGAAPPAHATTPTYTITTGATGSYAFADDTPAYPYIDSDGTFYFQSSHSLYGGSQGRSWQFWTGTDMDTKVSKAAISSAADNADTTVRCNNSPTGLEATNDPAGSQTSGYAERNYCDLIGVWVDPDSGTWYGAVHDEFTPSPFHDGLHYDSIDYEQSSDHGATWTITSHIITSPFSTVRENDQLWTPASDGSVRIGAGRCLDVTGAGTTAGTAVGTYGCNGHANQTWTVTGGTLVNPASGLCLTASGTAAGSTFTLEPCGTAATQDLTTPSSGTDGQIHLAADSGLCLDGSNALQLAACNDPTVDGRTQFPGQTYYYGDGDPKLFVDNASGYFYLYYDTQILNQAGGGRVDLGHVARAPISGKMAPSSWHKWYDGAWTQPGVGGKEADLIPSDGTSAGYLDDAYDPANTGTTAQQLAAGQLPSAPPLAWMDVAYDAYLGQYISMARPENPTTSSPLHIYATSDLSTQKWVDIGTVTNPSGGAWYRSMLDGVSKTANYLVGKTFRDYCMYSCTPTSGTEWVSTTIDTASTNLPAQPVDPGTGYQIAAGDGQYLAEAGGSLTTTTATGTAPAAQSWTFTPTGDGFFTIANAASGQDIGVDDTADSGRAWGAPLTLGSNASTSVGYQWFVQTVTDTGLPSGSYRLVNRYSGQALSLTSGAGGVVTAPQRDWANAGSAGDTHPVDAQTLTFPAGSTNLIPGGDFESGNLPGWNAVDAAVVTDAAAHSPTHDLRLQSGAGQYATMEYTVRGLSPNTTYTYSGWVRADSGASTSFGVKKFGGAQVSAHTSATGWTRESDTFTTGAADTSATVFCYLPSASSTSTCDDLSLTVG